MQNTFKLIGLFLKKIEIRIDDLNFKYNSVIFEVPYFGYFYVERSKNVLNYDFIPPISFIQDSYIKITDRKNLS